MDKTYIDSFIDSLLLEEAEKALSDSSVMPYNLFMNVKTVFTDRKEIECPFLGSNIQFLQEFKFYMGKPTFHLNNGKLELLNSIYFQTTDYKQTCIASFLYGLKRHIEDHYFTGGIVRMIRRKVRTGISLTAEELFEHAFEGCKSTKKLLLVPGNLFFSIPSLTKLKEQNISTGRRKYFGCRTNCMERDNRRLFVIHYDNYWGSDMVILDLKYIELYSTGHTFLYENGNVILKRAMALVPTGIEEHSVITIDSEMKDL